MPGPMSKPLKGKTMVDRMSGKWARHLRNMNLRAEWNRKYIQSSKMGPPPVIPYPKIGE